MHKKTAVVAAFLGTLSLSAESATFMDAAWASQLCQAWNKNPTLTGKLKFSGPKGEAMGVMGSFNDFLLLTGKVPGDKGACPSASPPTGKPQSRWKAAFAFLVPSL
jgi:hypothetical protein